MNKRRPKAIDLFSGCGGLTLGLKFAGYQVLAGVEVDAKASETYALNHPDVSLFHQDIREIEVSKMMRHLDLKEGKLDLLAACPPCQGFSRIRTRNGASTNADPRNDLALKFLEFAKVLKPKHLLLENVPGLCKQAVWKKIVLGLKREGYKLREAIVDASDFDVPQRRRRLILLGSKGDSVPNAPLRSDQKRTVRDALQGMDSSGGDALHEMKTRRSASVQEIISAIPKDGGSRSDLPERLRLACHNRTNGFSDVYGRMQLDSVAPTITSGCHNPSKGRFIHPTEDRAISLREAALLQGFPIDYKFNISHGKEAIALMIGNALPPPMIKAHAAALLGS